MFFCSLALRRRKLIGSTSRILTYRSSVVSMIPLRMSFTGMKSSAVCGAFFLILLFELERSEAVSFVSR